MRVCPPTQSGANPLSSEAGVGSERSLLVYASRSSDCLTLVASGTRVSTEEGLHAGVAQRQRQRSEGPFSIRSNRIVGTHIRIAIYDLAVRRFLIVVLLTVLFSVILGYTIALVYVMNMDVVAVQQPPYPDFPALRDATAELPLGPDSPGWVF